MVNFKSFYGIVTMISDFMIDASVTCRGCYKLISASNENGALVHFVVSPTTYFVDQVQVSVGDHVTGYYDGNAMVPMIYPPQYQALIMAKDNLYLNVKVDYFNDFLQSSDGRLILNISQSTPIVLTNSQPFSGDPANKNLIVIYGRTTASIPAQTVPHKIIVWC